MSQIRVTGLFPELEKYRTLVDWVLAHGRRVPLPPFEFLEGVDVSRISLQFGTTVWSCRGFDDCVSSVIMAPKNRNLIRLEVTVDDVHSGVGMVRLCECGEVIAFELTSKPPCADGGAAVCPLLKATKR